jgi:methionyl-tRNA formyltransferase
VGFFGTPAFAATTLQAVIDAGHEVACVVAQPDRPQGRGQKLQSPPTVELARAHGIEVLQPLKVKTGEFPERIEALGLEVAVVVAYGRILTPRLLAAPRRGCINVHASLLPRWRGAAPIQWSVLAGDATTGVCTMQMDAGLDTGAVLLREETPIGQEETSGQLHDRLAILGAALLVRTLAELDNIVPQPQPEEGVTYARMLAKEDGRLDVSRSAAELDAQVRGLSPWPGAFAPFRGDVLTVTRARHVPPLGGRCGGESPPPQERGQRCGGESPPPQERGRLVVVDGRPLLACGEGRLELLEVQLPGKRPVSGADFVRGTRLVEGEVLS